MKNIRIYKEITHEKPDHSIRWRPIDGHDRTMIVDLDPTILLKSPVRSSSENLDASTCRPTIARHGPTLSAYFTRPILIWASSRSHVLQGESSKTRSNLSRPRLLMFLLTHVLWWRLGGPKSTRLTHLSRYDCIRRPWRCHVSCNSQIKREHSPTRKELMEATRIKCGAL